MTYTIFQEVSIPLWLVILLVIGAMPLMYGILKGIIKGTKGEKTTSEANVYDD